MAAAEVRVDVAVLQQVEDGAGHVEPARRVQRGQPELVQQIHLKVGIYYLIPQVDRLISI